MKTKRLTHVSAADMLEPHPIKFFLRLRLVDGRKFWIGPFKAHPSAVGFYHHNIKNAEMLHYVACDNVNCFSIVRDVEVHEVPATAYNRGMLPHDFQVMMRWEHAEVRNLRDSTDWSKVPKKRRLGRWMIHI